jgi:uncharacterized cupredoxin-like copper-binding protein
MTGPRVLVPVALVASIMVGVIAVGHALAGPGAPVGAPLGPGEVTVQLTIRHSHFAPDHLAVRPGTTVRFVVQNDDPINHELIIGDDGVHQRHEAGTEPVHPPRPGEVSVPPGTTAETTFSFPGTAGSGSVVYACHLPGHFRFGMSGTVDVQLPAAG